MVSCNRVPEASPRAQAGTLKPEAPRKESTVYVTENGSKYHRAKCQYLKNGEVFPPMTASQAKSQGYEACVVCDPDDFD